MARLKDKVALITGGARGIGKAEAVLFAEEGAALVVTDIREELGQATAEEIRQGGGNAIFIRLDVTQEADWENAIAQTLETFGRLDVLINNAGDDALGSVEEVTLDQWRWLVGVNLDGVFLGTKQGIAAMKKSGGGSIVNTSSIYGLVGEADEAAYCASKGAVTNFTRSAALHAAQYRIRVNSVHPGYVRTRLLEEFFEQEGNLEEEIAAVTKLHPIGRLGRPEDVAYGVLYLASDESSFVTGSQLVIDGGFTAQ
jgi:NAD(P)-dependent dehydrogenase (short-subunit alcohol dehydrogenase family)